jgi:hypothetical protein
VIHTTDLCDFEIQLLREMVGQLPASPWGAAVGAALGSLKGFGLVDCRHGRYEVTPDGRAELVARGFLTP